MAHNIHCLLSSSLHEFLLTSLSMMLVKSHCSGGRSLGSGQGEGAALVVTASHALAVAEDVLRVPVGLGDAKVFYSMCGSLIKRNIAML